MVTKPRIFVIGDIHGNLRGLIQVLERSGFRFGIDILYIIGDVVDGWGEDLDCIRMLNRIKNKVVLLGNHDDRFVRFLRSGRGERIHQRTYDSFAEECPHGLDFFHDLPEDIQEYFNSGHRFVKEKIGDKHVVFVHAGFNRHFGFHEQPNNGNITFLWDRDLYLSALAYDQFKTPYPFKIREKNVDRVFIGHTPTVFLNGRITPVRLLNDLIINIDTGSGFSHGRITMMNVEDLDEVYHSDLSSDLYPELKSMKT